MSRSEHEHPHGRRREVREQRDLVDAWNEQRQVEGLIEVDVYYRDDAGVEHADRTRSSAWLLGGHTAVVLLESRSGGYALERVRVRR